MTSTETEDREMRELRLANRDAEDLDRICDLVERIRERNRYAAEEWYDLPDRILEEHIGEPLCIEVNATGDLSDWINGDMRLDEINVTLGTGGPARGVIFVDGRTAYAWHQDWWTTKQRSQLNASTAEILAGLWGLDEYLY